MSFDMISEPKVGALLATLAASKPAGRFLELGTGTGHGNPDKTPRTRWRQPRTPLAWSFFHPLPLHSRFERGLAQGQLSDYLPAPVLVGMMEGLTMATLEQANLGLVDDSGDTIVLGNLVLAGVSPDRAPGILAEARRWLVEAGSGDGGTEPR